MQLSMSRAYPGFDPDAQLLSIKIRFNGEIVRNTIAVDTDAGICWTLGKINDFTGPPSDVRNVGKVEILDFDTDQVLYATPDKA